MQVDNINDELSYQADETSNVLPVTIIEHLECLTNTSNVEVLDDDDDDIDLLNENYSKNHINNDDSHFDNNDDSHILLLINYK